MSVAEEVVDFGSLADFLGFSPQHFYYTVKTSEHCYSQIPIPKRTGGEPRIISIPSRNLRGIQKVILLKILMRFEVDKHAYAYTKGRGVIEAATALCGEQALLKVDLRDFFPSISSSRIYGLFRKLGFNNEVSILLTNLCCYQGCLPQGAPTSPYLSNLIATKLDQRMSGLAESWDMGYLRYSDDLFFHHPKNFNHSKLLGFCEGIVTSSGFLLNEQKTKFYPKNKPRVTLGILTHGSKIALPGKFRRSLRNDFFRASRNPNWGRRNLENLSGKLEWYKLVYGRTETYYQFSDVIKTIDRIMLHDTYSSN